MFDYAETAAEASAAIRDVGAPFVLTRVASAEYNTATGTVEGGNRRWNGHALRWDYSRKDIDGDNVLATDIRFIVSVHTDTGAAMEEPREGDRALFDGKWTTVVECKPLKPATTALYFEVQARA